MKTIKLDHIADLHLQPSDVAKIVSKDDVLAKMKNSDLVLMYEAIENELTFREHKRWAQ